MLGVLDSFNKLTGTIPRILDNVGLNLKSLIQNRSKDLEANKKLSGCVLRYLWEPFTDIMGIKLKLNPSKKFKR